MSFSAESTSRNIWFCKVSRRDAVAVLQSPDGGAKNVMGDCQDLVSVSDKRAVLTSVKTSAKVALFFNRSSTVSVNDGGKGLMLRAIWIILVDKATKEIVRNEQGTSFKGPHWLNLPYLPTSMGLDYVRSPCCPHHQKKEFLCGDWLWMPMDW